jgi:hypothetical protein
LALSLTKKEPGEEVVDRDGGLEFGETLGEEGGKVGVGTPFNRLEAVLRAKGGGRASDKHGAAAFGGALLTTKGFGAFSGVSGLEFHIFSLVWVGGETPPGNFCKCR